MHLWPRLEACKLNDIVYVRSSIPVAGVYSAVFVLSIKNYSCKEKEKK